MTGKKMLHWNLFRSIVQMCVIHGQTCIWESILMSFAHLKLDPKSYILIQMYLQYVLFVLNFIGFFVFLSWSFFQLAHKALIALLAYKSVTPYSLHYWNNGRREHTVYIKHLRNKDFCVHNLSSQISIPQNTWFFSYFREYVILSIKSPWKKMLHLDMCTWFANIGVNFNFEMFLGI